MEYLHSAAIGLVLLFSSIVGATLTFFHFSQPLTHLSNQATATTTQPLEPVSKQNVTVVPPQQTGAAEPTTNPCVTPQNQLTSERATLVNEPEFSIGTSVYDAANSSCFILVRTIEVTALEESYDSGYDPIATKFYRVYEVAVPPKAPPDSQPLVLAYCNVPEAPGDNQPMDTAFCFSYMPRTWPATTTIDDEDVPSDISTEQFDDLLQSLGFISILAN